MKDESDWMLQQALFFTKQDEATAKAKAKGKKRTRAPKGQGRVVKARKSAFALFRALDDALTQGRTVGLSAFTRFARDTVLCLSKRPLLVLFFDECSVNLAAVNWAAYKGQLRIIGIRDIFHRENNDVSLALKRADLWHVVILTTVVFNLPYGPWQGSAWFSQMQDAARDLLKRAPTGGRLFDFLYEAIARDRKETPTGTTHHKLQVLEDLLTSKGFESKGPRVALRRWFSWFQASSWHDACWHSRALCLLYLGIQAGIYKSLEQSPLANDASSRYVQAEESSDEEDAAEVRAAASVPKAAASASHKAKDPEGAELKDRQVKDGNQEVQALRKRCKQNTLFVAASVLCTPGLQIQVRLITVLANPICNQHSENARQSRAPEDVLLFYLGAAKGDYEKPLKEMCRLLQDPRRCATLVSGMTSRVSRGRTRAQTSRGSWTTRTCWPSRR